MKYLLSWVSSHLKISNWQTIFTIDELIKKISHHVAEVSRYEFVSYNDVKIHIGTIISNNNNICLAQLDNEEKIIHLPFWKDAITGSRYLIIHTKENKYRFATMHDFHAESKHHLLGPLYGTLEDQLLFVKELQKKTDYIIQIDNTSISNRPDLFSQRGLAREIACLYNIPLIPEAEIILDKTKYKKNISKNIFTNLSENINSICTATASFHEQESILEYLIPLCHLDVTLHSFLVDLSNYVMMDIGQPLHVFDKKKTKIPLIFSEKVSGKISCLDHTTITIEENAITITSEAKIHSLVGIIGGKDSSVTRNTKEIIIESASISKKYISKVIKLFDKRTESAIRNEKGSPAYGPEMALLRFLFLLKKEFGIEPEHIQFFSKNEEIHQLVISSQYISNVIGITISKEKITQILEGLGFVLHFKKNTNAEDSILVDVPWWRLDIGNQDDIAEEIIRHIGFNNIPQNAPSLPCQGYCPSSLIQNLKKYTVILGRSNEIISYGIGHEEIKKKWNYISNKEEILLKNAYSSLQTTLISSHIPAFLDIICKEIKTGASAFSIFEINPLWCKKNNEIQENITYSIAFYKEQADYNFYEYKNIIQSIFEGIGYEISWKKLNKKNAPHNLYSDISADITHQENSIGICGFIDPIILYKEIKKKGSIFAAEITLKNFLNQKNNPEKNTKSSYFDVSILIKKSDSSKMIIDQLHTAFGNIMNIEIIDWFESPEWPTLRSITLRIYIFNRDINDHYAEITQYLITQGYRLR